MPSNCSAGEDSWESLKLQGDQTNQSQRNQPSIFIGRTDAEAEAPILWPPDVKSRPAGKDPDAGKGWWQEEKRTVTEDKMFGWHHRLSGHEFEQTPGESEGQEAWHAAVPGVTKSWTRLSGWTTTRVLVLSILKIKVKRQVCTVSS